MKKKFINGILMVAMIFATTSSFVSCKDNVDDDIAPIYANLSKRSADLQNKINDLQTQINNIEPEVIQNIYNYGDTIIQQITQRFDTTIVQQVEDLSDEIKIINENITNMTLEVDEINNKLDNIDNRINIVGDSVKVLWARVDSILGILDGMVDGNFITSVVVDATRNDVFGIINTPVLKVNGLAAYYGENMNGIDEFPYAGIDFNVGGNQLAEYLEDYELPDEGFVRFDESDYITQTTGNAGQLVFTVNTTNYEDFDISKVSKIQIENSVGQAAPIDLNIRKSSVLINWVLGRTYFQETGNSVDNGQYIADATIKEGDLDPSKFQIEKFIDFKGILKSIKSRMEDIRDVEGEYTIPGDEYRGPRAVFKNTVREIMSIVFDLFKNDLDEKDLKNNVSYSPQRLAFFVEKDGKMKRVAQSDLGLFTTAIKPLSYNTFWEYEKGKKDNWILENVLERTISRIAREIREHNIGKVGIKAELVSLNDADESVTVKVNSATQTIMISNATQYANLKKAVNVNGGKEAVNEMVNKLLSTITLGSAAGKAAERINTWIDRGSEYLTNLIHKHLFTRMVAPIIIFETSNGMDRLCEGMFVNRGIMHAYLTSGTMELIVPAYKKYVALEKDGMLIQSAVLPGSAQSYDFDLSEKGDYKVIISCVDYFGYVITKKYDVYVK